MYTHQKFLSGGLLELDLMSLVLRELLPRLRFHNFHVSFFLLGSGQVLLYLLIQVLSAASYGLEEEEGKEERGRSGRGTIQRKSAPNIKYHACQMVECSKPTPNIKYHACQMVECSKSIVPFSRTSMQ